MDQLSTEAKKTLVEQVRFRRPKSWTMANQIELDQKVKAEQIALRAQRKEESGKPNLLRMPV